VGSNAPRKPVVTKSASEEPVLPVIELYGIAPAPAGRGFIVVRVEVQGDKVLSREVLSSDPEPRAHAVARCDSELRAGLLLGTRGGEA